MSSSCKYRLYLNQLLETLNERCIKINRDTVNPETPWGFPSSPIHIAELPSGVRFAFLARHGDSHQHSPSEVPVRANIAALKHIGVQAIVAFSAVGSLREEIAPGDFVIPSG